MGSDHPTAKKRGRKGLTNYSRTTIRYELTVCQNRLAM